MCNYFHFQNVFIIMKKLNLLITLLLLNFFVSNAQTIAEPQVIVRFKELFLKKDYTAIYSLIGEDFKARYPATANQGLLGAVYNSMGGEISFEFKSQNGLHYVYLIKGTQATAQAEFDISADQKITGLLFKPVEMAAPVSLFNVKSNNPLKTRTDKKVDSIIKKALRSTNIGTAIAVIKDGKVVNYGYCETFTGSGLIPTANDVFEIGSITKTFTATVLASLVKDKKIDLNQDFRFYLPNLFPGFQGAEPTITVAQLANHTSGLPNMPPFTTTLAKTGEDSFNYYTQEDLENYLKNDLRQNGTAGKFAYSNLGFSILGYVLEKASGASYATLVKKYVIAPLGLKQTFIEQRNISTKGHNENRIVSYLNLKAMAPAGMIKSNLTDLTIYAQHELKPKAGMLLTQTVTFSNEQLKVGLGWLIRTLPNGNEIIFHNGATTGYSSFIGFDKKSQTAVIILSNHKNDVTGAGMKLLEEL